MNHQIIGILLYGIVIVTLCIQYFLMSVIETPALCKRVDDVRVCNSVKLICYAGFRLACHWSLCDYATMLRDHLPFLGYSG